MRHLPLFLDVQGKTVLVVGAGAVAARKVALLREARARVAVVGAVVDAELAALVASGAVEHVAAAFHAAQLDGAWLAIAATDDPAVNAAVAAAAAARRVFVNVVDDAEHSSAIVPAIVDRDPVTIAVGTGGAAPVLARRLRTWLETNVDESLGALASLAARFRGRAQAALPDVAARRRFWERVLDGRVAALVRARRPLEAEAELARELRAGAPAAGDVTLVGAGPGDPGLLTLAGLRALQAADVVLYDRLVSADVLALARRDAERIDVGKVPGDHRTSQDRINELLVEHARRGRRVVRLKGGDPMIFARGGEELAAVADAGLSFRVVPGVTAALACGAYAGIPLTHREHAQGVTLVTAHGKDSLDALDWDALASDRRTLAVYMGVATLARFADELVARGRAGSTPVALVENGSRPEQRVVLATLATAVDVAVRHGVKSPALLIVGDVVRYARTLHWFGAAPLGGDAASALADAA